jgi:chitinase
MTYDFFGGWAAAGPTAPHSPLCGYSGIPIAGFDSATAIAKLKSKGIPGSKMLLGVGAYGRGWSGVTQSAPGGSATGVAPGTYEAGIEDYFVLASRPDSGDVAGTSWSFSGGQWWGFDRPANISGKRAWAGGQGLGGMFMWELSGDRSNALLNSW